MNFLDETTSGASGSRNEKKKVSSTLELAKKLGLLNDKQEKGNNKQKDEFDESELFIETPSEELEKKEVNSNQELIDFLLEESDLSQDKEEAATKTEDNIIEIEMPESNKSNKNLKKEENSNEGGEFISINIESNSNKHKKNKLEEDLDLSLIDDDKNQELIDFLLEEEESDTSDEEPDISIDDVDENALIKNKEEKEEDVKIEEELKDDFDEEEFGFDEENEEIKRKESDINSGLLVTAEDLERYFASLEAKQNRENKIIESKEEKKESIEDFDISKNIVENTPKTISSGDVLAFQSFEFKGKAFEYFKIWIVNIALTILTLGIYSAWAKVRNLRYIYGNTYLNNSNFEFNADPRRILYGRFIVVGFYALFLVASDILYNQTLALSVAGIFILLLPWLIRQAIRFKLKSASYRNIRFKFQGKARSFYLLAIGAIVSFAIVFSPIIISKTTHIINYNMAMNIYTGLFFLYAVIGIPLIYKKFKEIIINNSFYGETKFSFHATRKDAVLTFLKIVITTVVAGFIFGLLIVAPVKYLGLSVSSLESLKDFKSIIIAAVGAILYLSFIGLYKGITDGYLSNFVRNNTKIAEGEFKTSIYPYKLGIISMTNTLAIILSLGLLYPWAKMRYLKYKIENTQFACKNYNQFKATESKDVSAVGEEATDFFDIDIGV